MKITMVKLVLFLTLLTNIALSANENTYVRLIKSIDYSAHDRNKPQSTTIYNYDKKNRLDHVIIHMSDYPDMNSSIQNIYNDKNDLIQVLAISKVGTPQNLITQKVSNLFYYSGDRIIKQFSSSNGKIQTETNVIEWKGEMPIKSIMKIYNTQEKLVQLHTYHLDYKDNNIFHQEVAIEHLDYNQTTSTIIDIQYGDQKSSEYYVNEGNFYLNPLGMSYPKIILKSHSSSKIFKNGKQEYSSDDSSTYNTTYNEKGLPVSIEIINNLATGENRSYTVYEYEEFKNLSGVQPDINR